MKKISFTMNADEFMSIFDLGGDTKLREIRMGQDDKVHFVVLGDEYALVRMEDMAVEVNHTEDV